MKITAKPTKCHQTYGFPRPLPHPHDESHVKSICTSHRKACATASAWPRRDARSENNLEGNSARRDDSSNSKFKATMICLSSKNQRDNTDETTKLELQCDSASLFGKAAHSRRLPDSRRVHAGPKPVPTRQAHSKTNGLQSHSSEGGPLDPFTPSSPTANSPSTPRAQASPQQTAIARSALGLRTTVSHSEFAAAGGPPLTRTGP